jgi:hypothetical protein
VEIVHGGVCALAVGIRIIEADIEIAKRITIEIANVLVLKFSIF